MIDTGCRRLREHDDGGMILFPRRQRRRRLYPSPVEFSSHDAREGTRDKNTHTRGNLCMGIRRYFGRSIWKAANNLRRLFDLLVARKEDGRKKERVWRCLQSEKRNRVCLTFEFQEDDFATLSLSLTLVGGRKNQLRKGR